MDQRTYSSGAAKRLGIGVSTLRKYAAVLEHRGYHFERGTNNGRLFADKDIDVLTVLVNKVVHENFTIEDAVAVVWNADGEEQKVVSQAQVTGNHHDRQIEKLNEQIRQLTDSQIRLSHKSEQLLLQVEQLAEKMEERERDQALFQRMEDSRNKKKRKGIAFLRPLTTLTSRR